MRAYHVVGARGLNSVALYERRRTILRCPYCELIYASESGRVGDIQCPGCDDHVEQRILYYDPYPDIGHVETCKGAYCQYNPNVFCQEDSCSACILKPEAEEEPRRSELVADGVASNRHHGRPPKSVVVERECAAALLIRENPGLSIREAAGRMGLSDKIVRKLLDGMVDKGLLRAAKTHHDVKRYYPGGGDEAD